MARNQERGNLIPEILTPGVGRTTKTEQEIFQSHEIPLKIAVCSAEGEMNTEVSIFTVKPDGPVLPYKANSLLNNTVRLRNVHRKSRGEKECR